MMDKMQNFSDASEDEDDKVSNSSTNFDQSNSVFVLLLTTSFQLMCWIV